MSPIPCGDRPGRSRPISGGFRIRGRLAETLLLSTAIAVVAGTLSSARANAEVLQIGTLPGYANGSYAYDVSADGNAVVGYSAAVSYAAFLWTDAGGMTQIAGPASRANAISADGRTAAGYYYATDHTEAFVWSAGGGFQALGTAGYDESFAEGVSSNGNYVVGRLRGGGQTQAFVWTASGGIATLGYLTGGRPYSMAMDVSDGGIVVGRAQVASGSVQGFYKDLADSGNIRGLGYLPGGDYSAANSITPDAGYIVGVATDAGGTQLAVRWKAGAPGYGPASALDGVQGWGYSEAKSVSADGRIAVGSYKVNSGSTTYSAFRWEEGGNAQPLDQWLAATGVDVTGWHFEHAEGISDDGGTIVGIGRYGSSLHDQAFVARSGIVVAPADYTESVASIREASRLPAAVAIAAAEGNMPGTTGVTGLSVSGLYGHENGSSADLGGGMLVWRGDGLAVSAGGGAVFAESSPLYQGGSARYDGAWIGGGFSADVGKAVEMPMFSGLEFSAALRADFLEASIDRNYLNGATVETASGETDTSGITTVARVAWKHDLNDGVAITPHAQWMHNHTRIGAYAETGGAGAGEVSGQSSGRDIVSVGASVDWQVRPELDLTASYAFNHMTDATGAGVSVAVPGLGTFAVPGVAYDADWHTVGAGFGWNPGGRVRLDTSVSVNFGSDFPENWALGSRLSFGL